METLLFIALALVGLGSMAFISYNKPPTWLSQDKALNDNWKLLVSYSLVAGVLSGIAAYIVNLSAGWAQQSVVFASVGTFLLFQSIFTDFRLRLVDRRVQRVANAVSFLTLVFVLYSYGVEFDWVVALAFTAVAFAIGLLPGVGASDGRAFVFLVLSTYPIAGIIGVQWAIMLFVVVLVSYTVIYSVSRKDFSWKTLFTKLSFPLVPIIMLPAIIVTLFGRLFVGF